MKTYYDFKKEVIDKGYDVDGWYGFQCWDGMALYEKWLGYSVTNTDIHGFACDIWESRKTNGILKNFVEVEVMQPGDIAIFKKSVWTPSSHVAIFDSDIDGVFGWFLGQNQNGKYKNPNGGSSFNLIQLPYAALFDTAFRPKCFVNKPKNGWHYENEEWYYYTNGKTPSGEWKKINNKWYLFSPDGNICYGWQEWKDKTYYLDGKGQMVVGNYRINGKDYKFDSKGALCE